MFFLHLLCFFHFNKSKYEHFLVFYPCHPPLFIFSLISSFTISFLLVIFIAIFNFPCHLQIVNNVCQRSSSWSSFRRVTKFLQHNQPFPWGTGGNLTVPGEVRSNIIIFIIAKIAVTIISTSTITAIIINPQRWNSLPSKTALLDSGHRLPSSHHPHHQHDHHIDIIWKHHLHRRHSS